MRDLIFVSLEDWDDVWRRNQFLCAEWLRRFPEMRILFVGRCRDFSHALRKGRCDGIAMPRLVRNPEYAGLTVLKPSKVFPNTLRAGRFLNECSFRSQVRAAAKSLGLRNPLLWINDHFSAHMAGRMGERAVIYDITDDWTKMPSIVGTEKTRLMVEDKRLCEAADLVVVCSKALENSRAALSRRIERVPNGVDAAHYRGASAEVSASKDSQLGRPVFGYLGTLHADRLDISLVLALASRCPEARVVLCGPDYLRPQEKLRLQERENVELKAQVAYRDVPKVLAGFDVCIVPHHCNAFTNSLNPIKLWEYLASGKPIASTPVAGFSDYPDLICLGRGSDGFALACRRALQDKDVLSKRRIREAEAHSWQARVDQLTEIFRQEGWVGRESNSEPRENPLGRGAVQDPWMDGVGVGEVCHG